MNLTILDRIGSGGFGNVDLVINENGDQFAQKTFSINQPQPLSESLADNVKKRFIREANIQSGINHKNIVRVVHKNLLCSPPSFLMPVAESSLDKDITRNKTLDGNFLKAIVDILSGLEELHSIGIYHRDLKPQNVLRFSDSDGMYYAISDFGLMSVKDTQISALTKTGMKMGSDYYTAPEIVSDLRRSSAASDIYSVGCILHDFVGTSDRIPCGEIDNDSSPYAHIMRICTRRDPSRRFQSVSMLRDAIMNIDASTITHINAEASTYIAALAGDTELNSQICRQLVDYVSDNIDNDNAIAIFQKLSLDTIDKIINLDIYSAARLGELYSQWVSEYAFSFEQCDAICNRLSRFLTIDDLNCKSEVLVAMLLMGTSHNRWYVERKFASECGSSMPSDLAKRLALELGILESKMCGAIAHLERSIGVSHQDLHPEIVNMIQRVCH
ncbi:protein kinase domain-containing protein [Morganella morganii]|uniref:protein kinase domain-containing protein n=1 Tax=Morganella morganii TaxID=582 RepID=UPI00132F57B9|nr:protein kinase [Morganella morganii]